MYCIKCGVQMDNGEKSCPLCGTVVCHPDYIGLKKEQHYPEDKYPKSENSGAFWAILFTAAFIFSAFVVMFCNYQFAKAITWSGFVTGALVVVYTAAVLPFWFKRPNPVVFVPCAFGAAGLYLLYVNLVTDGEWFIPFALPILCGIAVSVSALVVLIKYVGRGRLFIFGGFFVLQGGFMLLCELLMVYTFEPIRFVGWSVYPLVAFCLLGAFLIFIGICRPAREIMERKFFI